MILDYLKTIIVWKELNKMKLSRNFLNDYLDVSALTDFEIADQMTNLGNEYASVERLAPARGLVIGEVLDCKKHPNSDHLNVCIVNVGEDKPYQIICGADNVRAGIKVIVSLPGAVLPGDFEIKKSNIRGLDSNGMICSLIEIGIEEKFMSQEDRDGIHILDSSAPVGGDPLAFLHFDDTVIDFELTSNRSDLLSVLGMAYEANIFTGGKVKLPEIKINKESGDFSKELKLDVQTENNPLYLARKVKNVVIKESPAFIRARLIASGIRPINNVIDISNYVMLEFGQPLHFFDARSFKEKIVVRMAEEGEEMTTLDNHKRTLSASDIVIANESKITGLAGVMGGLDSEIELDTKDLIIESAIFSGSHIRRTAKKILRSEASNRFEKGINPEYSYLAMDRACQLLEEYAEAEVMGGMLVHDVIDKSPKEIEIKTEEIVKILGMKLSDEEVSNALDKLAFTYKLSKGQFVITVPNRRLDVTIAEDIVEEVGRVIGINNIESTLPVMESISGKYDIKQGRINELGKRLRAIGLYETISYSLVDEKKVNMFRGDQLSTLSVQSPMTEDRKYLRTSLIPSLIEVYDYNFKHKNKDIAIYESSNVYFDSEEGTGEIALLSGLISGTLSHSKWQKTEVKADFYSLKGIVEDLLEYLGLSNRYSFEAANIPAQFHPYQTQEIYVDRQPVGYIGKVHPSYSKYDLFVFELNMDKLLSYKIRNIKDKALSVYPNIEKDLAFVVDRDVPAEFISRIIKKVGSRLLISLNLFDLYEGENLEANKKSLAYRLVFNDASKTLTDEEVNNVIAKIVAELEKNGAELRDK